MLFNAVSLDCALAQTISPRVGSQHAQPNNVLVLSPQPSVHRHETHAALVLSKESYERTVRFSAKVQTTKQLRQGSHPNPWECAWVVWHYADNHFYYLILKPNGWEIGRHDPNIKGGQIFLKTGEQSFPLHKWHRFDITQTDDEISVIVDDIELTRFIDRHPFTSGRVGFYTEDAEIIADDVTAPFAEDFNGYAPSVTRKDGSSLRQWIISYLGHGYAAIRQHHR